MLRYVLCYVICVICTCTPPGIGQATAYRLANVGYHVLATVRDESKVRERG